MDPLWVLNSKTNNLGPFFGKKTHTHSLSLTLEDFESGNPKIGGN